MNIKEARIKAGLTQQKMSDIFGIPKRTIENWETKSRKCPVYVENLILEKLESMILLNGREVLKKAMSINKLNNSLPQVEIGETVTLKDVCNVEVVKPIESKFYNYKLTDTKCINYCFEVIEEKEDILDTVIKITNIKLLKTNS